MAKRKAAPAAAVAARKKDQSVASSAAKGKQKILVIAHNHPDLFPGGGELLAWQLFETWKVMAGTDSTFLAATGNFSRNMHNGTRFLSMDGRDSEFLYHSDSFSYFKLSHREPETLQRDLKTLLLEEKPDIVHVHHVLRFGVEMLQVIKQTLPDAGIFMTLHDFIPMCYRDGQMIRKGSDELCSQATPARCHQCFPEFSESQFRLRELYIKTHFDLVDAFISPSQFLANRYAEWGIAKEKLHVIANATLHARPVEPRALKANGTRNHFAYFGQISRYKGVMVLLDAAERLQQQGHTDVSVTIHGNISAQTEEFKAEFFARLESLGDVVSFAGRYDPEGLPARMQQADWVVVPSLWWENSPLVIAEAQRHKRPVICSGIGGMAELVEHEKTGLHVPPGSAHALADTMLRAMQDTALWEQCAAQIQPPHMLEEMADHYLQLFADCKQSKGAA